MHRRRNGECVCVSGRQKCEVFPGSELIWDSREVEKKTCAVKNLGIPLPRVVGIAAPFERVWMISVLRGVLWCTMVVQMSENRYRPSRKGSRSSRTLHSTSCAPIVALLVTSRFRRTLSRTELKKRCDDHRPINPQGWCEHDVAPNVPEYTNPLAPNTAVHGTRRKREHDAEIAIALVQRMSPSQTTSIARAVHRTNKHPAGLRKRTRDHVSGPEQFRVPKLIQQWPPV